METSINYKKTVERGNITELQVQLEFLKKGYTIFAPVNDGCSVDLVLKTVDGYKGVQIKTASPTSTGFRILLYSTKPNTDGSYTKKRYSEHDISFFATVFNDKAYLIPITDVLGMGSVTLRFDDTYKNQNATFLAKTYEL